MALYDETSQNDVPIIGSDDSWKSSMRSEDKSLVDENDSKEITSFMEAQTPIQPAQPEDPLADSLRFQYNPHERRIELTGSFDSPHYSADLIKQTLQESLAEWKRTDAESFKKNSGRVMLNVAGFLRLDPVTLAAFKRGELSADDLAQEAPASPRFYNEKKVEVGYASDNKDPKESDPLDFTSLAISGSDDFIKAVNAGLPADRQLPEGDAKVSAAQSDSQRKPTNNSVNKDEDDDLESEDV